MCIRDSYNYMYAPNLVRKAPVAVVDLSLIHILTESAG